MIRLKNAKNYFRLNVLFTTELEFTNFVNDILTNKLPPEITMEIQDFMAGLIYSNYSLDYINENNENFQTGDQLKVTYWSKKIIGVFVDEIKRFQQIYNKEKTDFQLNQQNNTATGTPEFNKTPTTRTSFNTREWTPIEKIEQIYSNYFSPVFFVNKFSSFFILEKDIFNKDAISPPPITIVSSNVIDDHVTNPTVEINKWKTALDLNIIATNNKTNNNEFINSGGSAPTTTALRVGADKSIRFYDSNGEESLVVSLNNFSFHKNINVNNHLLAGLPSPITPTEATNKQYVDNLTDFIDITNHISGVKNMRWDNNGNLQFWNKQGILVMKIDDNGNIEFFDHYFINAQVGNPVDKDDLSNKDYVDITIPKILTTNIVVPKIIDGLYVYNFNAIENLKILNAQNLSIHNRQFTEWSGNYDEVYMSGSKEKGEPLDDWGIDMLKVIDLDNPITNPKKVVAYILGLTPTTFQLTISETEAGVISPAILTIPIGLNMLRNDISFLLTKNNKKDNKKEVIKLPKFNRKYINLEQYKKQLIINLLNNKKDKE